MKALKFLLLGVLVLVVGIIGLNTAQQRGWLANTPLASARIPQILSAVNRAKMGVAQSKQVPESLSTQFNTLTDRSTEVAGHVQQVLGTHVEVDTDPQPAHERAFEYGRYLYCQQVVKDFEQKQANSSSAATPAPTDPASSE